MPINAQNTYACNTPLAKRVIGARWNMLTWQVAVLAEARKKVGAVLSNRIFRTQILDPANFPKIARVRCDKRRM